MIRLLALVRIGAHWLGAGEWIVASTGLRTSSPLPSIFNGARLYLDVGANREYASPECDNAVDTITYEKERILEGLAYREKHDLPLSSPRVPQINLSYHDIKRSRGLYYLLERKGRVQQVTSDLAIFEAKSRPPQNTRARLRGEFMKAGRAKGLRVTCDWEHLLVNDVAGRKLECTDPFQSVDQRVAGLIRTL